MLVRFLNGKKGPVITLRATGARFFFFKYMYWSSRLNFFCGVKFIKVVNPRTELGLDIEDTNIYEFALQRTNRHAVRSDYQLPTSSYGRNFYFDLHHVFFPQAPNQIKKIFRLPNGRFSNEQLQKAFKKDWLITNEEKEI